MRKNNSGEHSEAHRALHCQSEGIFRKLPTSLETAAPSATTESKASAWRTHQWMIQASLQMHIQARLAELSSCPVWQLSSCMSAVPTCLHFVTAAAHFFLTVVPLLMPAAGGYKLSTHCPRPAASQPASQEQRQTVGGEGEFSSIDICIQHNSYPEVVT